MPLQCRRVRNVLVYPHTTRTKFCRYREYSVCFGIRTPCATPGLLCAGAASMVTSSTVAALAAGHVDPAIDGGGTGGRFLLATKHSYEGMTEGEGMHVPVPPPPAPETGAHLCSTRFRALRPSLLRSCVCPLRVVNGGVGFLTCCSFRFRVVQGQMLVQCLLCGS